MAATRPLERRARGARASEPDDRPRQRWRDRIRRRINRPPRLILRAAAIAAVILATLAGSTLALSGFEQTKRLSAGSIRLSVSPFHHGALDLYVPLVDWGVRFDAVRLPARLHVDLRSVDRREVARVAHGGSLDVDL